MRIHDFPLPPSNACQLSFFNINTAQITNTTNALVLTVIQYRTPMAIFNKFGWV
ncbi:MAG: hypothetical protein IPM98_13735 [Lewinellaceae bacterium]|nr:hypothetical protein [Lewinellaceae bacterium]